MVCIGQNTYRTELNNTYSVLYRANLTLRYNSVNPYDLFLTRQSHSQIPKFVTITNAEISDVKHSVMSYTNTKTN
jgi:hypothetical protein